MAKKKPTRGIVPLILDGEDETEAIDTYGVGIGAHSRYIQVCVFVSDNGQLLRYEQEFTTDWSDLKASRQWIIDCLHSQLHDIQDFHFTIESTGAYHYPVLRALEGTPRVIHPERAGQAKRKTDVLDARLLAHQDITGMWRDAYIPGDEEEILRSLCQMHRQWQEAKTRASNRISGFLLRFGHTLTSYAKIGNSYTNAILEDMIAGNVPDAPGVCEDGLLPDAQRILDLMLVHWKECEQKARDFSDWALNYCTDLECVLGTGEAISGKDLLKLLETVPGIGPVTALTWIAEVGWPGRFPSAKACAAYCGCEPALKLSAGKVKSSSRKAGNKPLHRALVLAAGRLISRKKEPFGQWGCRLMKAKAEGGYRKACGAVGRRLCIALYHIHMRGEAFSYEGYHFWRQKKVRDGRDGPVCALRPAPPEESKGKGQTRLRSQPRAAGVSPFPRMKNRLRSQTRAAGVSSALPG